MQVVGLCWPDVDLKRAVLQVRVTLQRIKGKWLLLPPKAAKSAR